MPVFLLIFTLWLVSTAHAGPWLRPSDEGFLAIDSFASTQPGLINANQYNSVYLEYGLHNRSTLGLSGGINHNNEGALTVYFSQPMGRTSINWPHTYNIGVGGTLEQSRVIPHLRLGASVGRGGLFANGKGWLQIDAHSLLTASRAPTIKVETTLGTRGGKDWLYLLPITVEKTADVPWFAGLSPSIAVPLRKRQHVLVGLTASTLDGGRYGLRSSVWYRF